MRQHNYAMRPRMPSNRAGRRRGLIRLTPLIDVVFILLIFFMLASSFLDWRALDLTAASEAEAGASMEGALLVEIRSNGLRLSGVSISLDALGARMEARAEMRPGQQVLVKPARGITVQEAVRVLDRLAGAGITQLSLIRDPDA